MYYSPCAQKHYEWENQDDIKRIVEAIGPQMLATPYSWEYQHYTNEQTRYQKSIFDMDRLGHSKKQQTRKKGIAHPRKPYKHLS